MAKGQQRSNREAKKPKIDKTKLPPRPDAAQAPKKVTFGKRGLNPAR